MMTCFSKSSHAYERDLIPNVIEPNTINSMEIVEIYNKRVIHALTMNNIDKYHPPSREDPPFTMY